MDGMNESIKALAAQYRRERDFHGAPRPLLVVLLRPEIDRHNARYHGSVTFADIESIGDAKAHPQEAIPQGGEWK